MNIYKLFLHECQTQINVFISMIYYSLAFIFIDLFYKIDFRWLIVVVIIVVDDVIIIIIHIFNIITIIKVNKC